MNGRNFKYFKKGVKIKRGQGKKNKVHGRSFIIHVYCPKYPLNVHYIVSNQYIVFFMKIGHNIIDIP